MAVLTQTSHDLPELRLKRARVARKEEFLKRQAAKATQELMEIDKLIARREAHADAALAAIKAADALQQQQQQLQQQPPDQVKATKVERATSATKSSHKRPRSPMPVGLLKASDPEEKKKQLAIWPPGAKRR